MEKENKNRYVMVLMNKIMKVSLIIISLCLTFMGQCSNLVGNYKSKTLEITQLTTNTFVHTSILKIPNYGNFPCNGLVYINNNEAVVFDTPVDDATALELINWIEKELGCTIKAIVVNHAHDDCLGGLKAFHNKGIASYAYELALQFANRDGYVVPQNGFVGKLELEIGDTKIINGFVGEGHTFDNIISYMPDEKVMFGGCLIKEVGVGKGNVKFANLEQWSHTVTKIKERFTEVEFIVPGHGKSGGAELFDYTIELFKPEE